MNYSAEVILTQLRSKETKRDHFRFASERLAELLAYKTLEKLPKIKTDLTTPVGKTTGEKLKNNQVIIPILRSGLAMLNPFLKVFEEAKVGFLGMRRDEKSFEARLYYQNLPPFNQEDDIIILDPMIATGGSAVVSLKILNDLGIDYQRITYVGMVAAPEGLKTIKEYPLYDVIVGAVDERLNEHKFIVPGLGDFGDRYFGTEG